MMRKGRDLEELEPKLDVSYLNYMRRWSKIYLGRVRSCVHTIAMIRSEIAELDGVMDGIGAVRYDKDNVMQSPNDDAMVDRIERRNMLKAEFEAELDANLQAQSDAHRALRNVRQPWRALLTYRYLNGMSWADIKKKLEDDHGLTYSDDYIRKEMHDNGLIELFPFIPHEYDELPEAI